MLTNFYLNKTYIPDGLINDQIGQPYIQLTNPKEKAISINELKEQLRLPEICTGLEGALNAIICAVQSFAEIYTGRVFINTRFKTFRDYFPPCIEIRKSPFIDLLSFKYLKDDVLTDVPSDIYYMFTGLFYNKIERLCGSPWPNDFDKRRQTIEIEFDAGYGSLSKDVPCDIRIAMLNHAAQIYTDRGDCMPCGCSGAEVLSSLPGNSKLLYNKYRIKSLNALSGC